jgi:RNA polymerase sigma-70 factor (ECF subfamily)
MAGGSLTYGGRFAGPGGPGAHRVEPRARQVADSSTLADAPAPAIEGPRSSAAEPSLRRLFDAHYAPIWRLLRRLGVPAAQLDDAAQEVFWVAARKFVDIEPGREQAFLYGVALRVASNDHRRRKSVPETADLDALALHSDDRPSPEEELEHRQTRALLDIVLDRMPIELRTVFVLCELEELEVRDVAALEGVPIGTASSRLRRAREEFSAIAKRVRATLVARGGLR